MRKRTVGKVKPSFLLSLLVFMPLQQQINTAARLHLHHSVLQSPGECCNVPHMRCYSKPYQLAEQEHHPCHHIECIFNMLPWKTLEDKTENALYTVKIKLLANKIWISSIYNTFNKKFSDRKKCTISWWEQIRKVQSKNKTNQNLGMSSRSLLLFYSTCLFYFITSNEYKCRLMLDSYSKKSWLIKAKEN